MDRRRFIKLLTLGGALLAIGKLIVNRRHGGLAFYVAGARFGALPTGVRVGDGVRVRREPFGAQIRLSLHTEEGSLIGYVPRELIPLIESRDLIAARLTFVDLNAVPWKRYKVELTL